MGAGIAQLGCAAGMRTLLHDPASQALERGAEGVRRGLARWVEKGRVGDDAATLLEPVGSLDELAPCELVIEAAPEVIDLKVEMLGKVKLLARRTRSWRATPRACRSRRSGTASARAAAPSGCTSSTRRR